MLAGIVGSQARRAAQPRNRRGEDYAATAVSGHVRIHRFDSQKRPGDIYLQHLPEYLGIVVRHRCHLTFDAGVGEQYVNAAKPVQGSLNIGSRVCFTGHVSNTIGDSRGAKAVAEGREPVAVTVNQQHAGPAFEQLCRRHLCDVARTTCENNNFTLYTCHNRSLR